MMARMMETTTRSGVELSYAQIGRDSPQKRAHGNGHLEREMNAGPVGNMLHLQMHEMSNKYLCESGDLLIHCNQASDCFVVIGQ
jgi:hypothetical protein